MTSPERAELKETTLNELGAAVGRSEIRLQHIENKQDWLAETMDRMLGSFENRLMEHLSHTSAVQLKIEESLKAIITGLIEHLPESPRLKRVRRALKKGKKR